MEITWSEDEIRSVADQLLDQFGSVKVWTFEGEMGAGKTTLIKELCNSLGVVDEMSSPTFSIINEYLTSDSKEIYHFDFYRLEETDEAVNIGVEDYFFSGRHCFIEWPDIIDQLLPEKYLEISIKLVDSKKRHLTTRLNG